MSTSKEVTDKIVEFTTYASRLFNNFRRVHNNAVYYFADISEHPKIQLRLSHLVTQPTNETRHSNFTEMVYHNFEVGVLCNDEVVINCQVPDRIITNIQHPEELWFSVLQLQPGATTPTSLRDNLIELLGGETSTFEIAYHHVYNKPERDVGPLQINAFTQGLQGLHYALVVGLPKSGKHPGKILLVDTKPITPDMVFDKYIKLYTNTDNQAALNELKSIDRQNRVMEISSGVSAEELERLENQPNN